VIGESLQTLAASYALGSLEPSEARAFEAQMDGNAELRAFVAELHEVTAALAAGAPQASAPPALRDRVLASARSASPAQAGLPRVIPFVVRTAATPLGIAWAAAAAFLVLAGYQQIRVRRRDTQLRQVMAALDTTMSWRNVLEARLETILDTNTKMYTMSAHFADAVQPRSGAQIFWSRNHQTWLIHAYNLPKLPEGKVYQLWYITAAGTKISAGLLHVSENGQGTRLVPVPEEAKNATLAAITAEPAGGSPQPTGSIVMAGSVAEEQRH
jgi:anti-sigma-K factor RskA